MSSASPDVVRRVVHWYRKNGRRDLPWRAPDTTPWQVLVSEVMLAQTPVARVAPAYVSWLEHWPDARATASASPADLLRAWGRLGYPRRVLRLREAAIVIDRDYGGQPPADRTALVALPGIGEYTSAAVLAFGYGHRVEVLDTNVRRVLARVVGGTQVAPVSLSNPERERATALLPTRASAAAEWSIAVMELGALVCTAKRPDCTVCPVAASCAWRLAGMPESPETRRRTQAWEGTDRQCRGALLAVLREAHTPVTMNDLAAAWPDGQQRERCLDSLLDDGLVDVTRAGAFRLPPG